MKILTIRASIIFWMILQCRILELGSGTGVLGMAISKMSTSYPPASLVLTDGDDKAVDLLTLNLRNPINHINPSLVRATRLLWGVKSNDSIACPHFAHWCRNNYAIWGIDNDADVRFDSIFAGDVLYKADLPKMFFETAFALLAKKYGSSLWLCHIPRHGVTHENVIDAAQTAGFTVTTTDAFFITKVRGCPLEDLNRSVTYRMYLEENVDR
jgi:Lysine methyltransferase